MAHNRSCPVKKSHREFNIKIASFFLFIPLLASGSGSVNPASQCGCNAKIAHKLAILGLFLGSSLRPLALGIPRMFSVAQCSIL